MKKVLSLMLAIAVLASAMSIAAFAADTSTAAITFLTGTVTIDPENPGDPDYGGIGSKNIVFTDTQITGLAQTIDTTTSGPLGLIVTDASGSATSRWNISASITDFTSGTTPLNGAILKLTAQSADMVGPAGANNTSPNAPEQNTITLVSTDAAKIIFQSNTTNGSLGKWGSNWKPQLDILPGTAQALAYQATLTWTLATTP